MCSSYQCQLSSMPASSKLSVCCALLSSPRPSQSSGSLLASLFECFPQDSDLDTVSLPALQFPGALVHLGISTLHLLEVNFVPFLEWTCLFSGLLSSPLSTVPSCLSYFFCIYLGEAGLIYICGASRLIGTRIAETDSKERIFFFLQENCGFQSCYFYLSLHLFIYLSIYLFMRQISTIYSSFPQNTWWSSCLSLLSAGTRASRLHTQLQSYFQSNH